MSKINDCQTNIIYECLLLLATKSCESDNNCHNYVLPATCNFQIVSFLIICLLLQFLDLLCICSSVFIFCNWFYFSISFFFWSTLSHFCNFHFLCEYHLCHVVSLLSFGALCSLYVVHNFWFFWSCHCKLLTVFYFSFTISWCSLLFVGPCRTQFHHDQVITNCFSCIVLLTPHKNTRWVDPWSSNRFYIYVSWFCKWSTTIFIF